MPARSRRHGSAPPPPRPRGGRFSLGFPLAAASAVLAVLVIAYFMGDVISVANDFADMPLGF